MRSDFFTSVISALSNLKRILINQLIRIPHPPDLITLSMQSGSSSSTIPHMMSDHYGLPSARILLGSSVRSFPQLRWVLLEIFILLTPTCSLAINSHLSMLYSELSPISHTIKFYPSGPHTYHKRYSPPSLP